MAVDVLVVGAGPTGLALALWLVRHGRSVRIIDKSAGPGATSRAMVVQARTLELYRQLDLADAMVAAGHRNPAMNLWVGGRPRARVALGDAGAGLTPYPFVLVYPQDQHEQLLATRLRDLGVVVERQTELASFEDRGSHVSARLLLPDDSEGVCGALYLAGCDGARSSVRQQLGGRFEGSTYGQRFYVADVAVSRIEPRADTGVGDAINLAWKIAAVLRGEAPDGLLDSYESERQEFARALVNTTDRVFTFATARGSVADFVRRHLAPTIVSLASRLETTRELMFRLISQTALDYRSSVLSAGRAGKVQGGDRLPWVLAAGVDNFDTLAATGWQVHVYGATGANLRHWCQERTIPLHVFAWHRGYHDAGIQRGAAYLLRPDTYVAMADPTCSVAAVHGYFAARGFSLAER